MPTETLPGGTVVCTGAQHKIGTDALLLARFCEPKRGWSACDLGAGSGAVLLSLLDAGLAGRAVGVEQDAAGAAMLAEAARLNGFANLSAVQGDLRRYTSPTPFDLVVCNPPYFGQGMPPPEAGRAAARHEITCTLPDVCRTAARILKDRGRLCLCYPAAKLAPLVVALQAEGLAPKRMQLARKAHSAPPWLVLMDARKAGGVGLSILPDIILPPGSAVRY